MDVGCQRALTTRLVLFNTSHKHNKITRPCKRDDHVIRVTRRGGLAFRRPHSLAALSPYSSPLLCLSGSCRRGRCCQRTRVYYPRLNGYVVVSFHGLQRSPRELKTSLRSLDGVTVSYYLRQASPCTTTRRKTLGYARRQRRSCTPGRSARPVTCTSPRLTQCL